MKYLKKTMCMLLASATLLTGCSIGGKEIVLDINTTNSHTVFSVSRCKYGKPGNPPLGCLNLRAAFRYCICLACCTGRLACQFPDFLCGSQKILAGGIEGTIIQASDKSHPSHPALFCWQQFLQCDMPASCL